VKRLGLLPLMKKLRAYENEHGRGNTSLWILSRLLRRILRLFYATMSYNLVVLDLSKLDGGGKSDGQGYDCKKIKTEDLPIIEECFGKSFAESAFSRLEHSRGYVIVHEAKVCAYSWSTDRAMKNEGIKPFVIDIAPKEGHIYIYDSYTSPPFRDKKLFSCLMDYLLRQERENGFKKAFLIHDNKNAPMGMIVKKFGFSVEGEISCKKFLWIVVKNVDVLKKVSRSRP
jgi:hypothetical protein